MLHRTGSYRLLLPGLLLLALGRATPMVADPLITGLVGDPVDGGRIEIKGEHFGPGAKIISWDDFEAYRDNDLVNGLKPPIGPRWQSGWSGDLRPRISAYRSISGLNAARCCWNDDLAHGDDEAGSLAYWGWTGQGPFTRVYYTYWRYLAGSGGDWDRGSKNHKTVYFYGTEAGEHPQFLVGATMSGGVWLHATNGGANWFIPRYKGDQYRVPDRTLDWNATKDCWQRWEGYVSLNPPYGEANDEVELFHQGRRIFASDTLCLAEAGGYKDFRIGHLDNSYATYDSLYGYFDDLYLATGRARIEIGDNADFSACTRRDIQIFSTWSDTSITCRLRLPAREAGKDYYIFVVDEAGAAAAFPIDLAGRGSGHPD